MLLTTILLSHKYMFTALQLLVQINNNVATYLLKSFTFIATYTYFTTSITCKTIPIVNARYVFVQMMTPVHMNGLFM